MNTIFLYLFSLLLSFFQTDPEAIINTYKYEHTSTHSDKKRTDFIQFVIQDDMVVKGIYYGNEYGYRYIAAINLENGGINDLSFSLINFKLFDKDSNTFKEVKLSQKEEFKSIYIETCANFMGVISDKQLILKRHPCFADSRSDKMTFDLVEE